MAQENSVKKSHSEERKEPYSKRSKITKKNSWVDEDLTKSPKKKCLKRTELCRMLKRTEPLKTGWKKS